MKKLLSPKRKYHLVFYVEGCTGKLKKFYDKTKMKQFIKEFQAEYPLSESRDSGSWVDYAITDIGGTTSYLGG